MIEENVPLILKNIQAEPPPSELGEELNSNSNNIYPASVACQALCVYTY